MKSSNAEKLTIFKKKFGKKDFFNKLIASLGRFIIKINRSNQKKKYFLNQIAGFTDDIITDTINLEGLYEKRELITLISWLKPLSKEFKKSTLIDVGANIGNHSMFFSDHFKKIVAIEPYDKIFKVLKLNTEKTKNIKILNYAISDNNYNSYLNIKISNLSGTNLIKKPKKKSKKVICKKLDSIIKKTEKIALIKIDVEGHELKVIKGALNVIKNNKPIILFEHHLQNFKSNYSPTINFLKKNGYKKFAIVASNPRISIFDSFITKLFKNITHFWLNNMSFTVSLEDKIKPDYYPFIIAIPDKYNI